MPELRWSGEQVRPGHSEGRGLHSPRRQHDSQYLGCCVVFLCRVLTPWQHTSTSGKYMGQGVRSCIRSPPAFMSDSYVTATMTPHDRASAPCVAISSSSCLSSQHLFCPSVPPQSCLEIPPAGKMPGPCHLPPAGTLECLSLVVSWIVGWWIKWRASTPALATLEASYGMGPQVSPVV